MVDKVLESLVADLVALDIVVDMNIAMVDLDLETLEALEGVHLVVEIADLVQEVPDKVVGQGEEDKDSDLVVVCPVKEKK